MKIFAFPIAMALALSFLPKGNAAEGSSTPSVYTTISDICHPTLEDYRRIQGYLQSSERDLSGLEDYEWITRNVNIIGTTEEEQPSSGIIHVNCTADDEKENCLIAYATFNRNYPNALKRLVNHVKNSDFKGDILFQIGGWPNTEMGDLVLAHVPYAFKICFFKKAQRLGYKRCLWLDTAVVPVVSLNEIFSMIKDKGYITFGPVGTIGAYMNAPAAQAFGLTLEQTQAIPSCSSGLFGVDFTKEIGKRLIDSWYKAAKDPKAFFTRRPDQNPLSIILFQEGISDFISLKRVPHTEVGEPILPDSLFVLDRMYAHYKQ